MSKCFVTVLSLLTALVFTPSLQAANDTFDAAQRAAIQHEIHDYLVSHPEVLVEASQALQKKQQKNMMARAERGIADNADALFASNSPQVGNPKGSVTIVEFFDYQCVHCKKMAPVMKALLKDNPNLRVVYKDFPIFGKSSNIAAEAAVAAQAQGKYSPMHEALILVKERLTPENIMAMAKGAGLDTTKLKKAMDSKPVSEALNANRQLAERMGLMGTPAFVIAATPDGKFSKGNRSFFLPGAASKAALENMIKQAAQKQ